MGPPAPAPARPVLGAGQGLPLTPQQPCPTHPMVGVHPSHVFAQILGTAEAWRGRTLLGAARASRARGCVSQAAQAPGALHMAGSPAPGTGGCWQQALGAEMEGAFGSWRDGEHRL